MSEPEVSFRFDLHCHTRRSDGALTAAEVAEAAIAAGLRVVGIADHLRSTALPREQSLGIEDLPGYIEEVRSLRARLREQLTVLVGIEINFSLVQTDLSFLSCWEADKNPVNHLDYVLFEHVNSPAELGLGLDELLKIRPLFQVPVGLAHNDLEQAFGGIVQPAVLAQILAQSRIFVELSTSERHLDRSGEGQRPWYRAESEFVQRFFAAAAKVGLELSVGSDAHATTGEVGDVDDALGFLAERGLEANAVVRKHWGGARP